MNSNGRSPRTLTKRVRATDRRTAPADKPCRRGGAGYLRGLPVTALELMPVHEFKSTASWGYNPAFFFAIDGFYGGSAALAAFGSNAGAHALAPLSGVALRQAVSLLAVPAIA